MANASEIRSGRAFVEFFGKDGPLMATFQRISMRARRFSQSIQSMGAKMAQAMDGVRVPLTSGVLAFTSFEAAMARVKAISQATDEEFDALRNEALRLGATTAYSASQAAQTMGVFAMAGLDAAQTIKAIAPTLDLAAAGQLDLAVAADIATKVMFGMGYEAGQLRSVLDVLGTAMVTANTDLVMLGEAFKYVGPIAKSAGLSLHEITAAIQMLSNAGIQGEMAGTTLRGIVMSITNPTAEAAAEMQRLGVRVKNAQGNVRGLAEIIEDLEKALSGMGSGDALQSLGTIFTTRSAAGAAELAGQGAEKMRRMTRRLEGGGGTVSRIAQVQLDTLQGSFLLLKSSVEGLGIAIGSILNPLIRRTADTLASLSTVIMQIVERNPELVQGFLRWGLAIAAVAAAAMVMAVALKLALSLGGLIVAGLVGIGFALYQTSEHFRELGDTATNTMRGVSDALQMGDLSLAGEILLAGLRVAWAQILASFSDLWDKVTHATASAFVGIWKWLREGWESVSAFVAKTWARAVAAVRKSWVSNKFWLSEKTRKEQEAEIDEELQKRLEDISNKKKKAHETIRREAEGMDDALEQMLEQAKKDNAAPVRKAQGELDAITRKAKARRELKQELDRWKKVGQDLVDHYLGRGGKKPPPRISDAANAAIGNVEVMGGFSAMATDRMGYGTSLAERTAIAAERAANAAERIAVRDADARFV